MPKAWTNDYGDIPRWYWVPAVELHRMRPRRRRGHGIALARVLMAIAGVSDLRPR